jgi:hypothetical protein
VQSSVTTFGLFGRLVCTVFLLGVLAWFLLYGGLFGLAGAIIWIGWILPRALRDVWRRAALPSTELTQLRDSTARELAESQTPQRSHPVFDKDNGHPPRW